MDHASALVHAVVNELQHRAFAAMSAATPGARRRRRAHALAPGGFDADFAELRETLVDEHDAVGFLLADFLLHRRMLPDAPPPRASRAAAAPWLLVLAAELPATHGLLSALVGNGAAWGAYIAPLERARDLRLRYALVAARTNMAPPLPDARPR